ncbi:MAG: PAS domain-containing sensor histidine kinase [Candidatus Reddybacter sp.]
MQTGKPSADPSHLAQGVAKVYIYYRFSLSLVLLVIFYSGTASQVFGAHNPQLYLFTSIGYTVLATLTLAFLLIWQKDTSSSLLLFTHFFLDLIALILLIHSSGGPSSGLGLLMLITVAASSLVFSNQLALLTAALASILLLTEELYSAYVLDDSSRAIFPAGLLGFVLFLTAVLCRMLNERLRRSEQIALRESDQAAHLQDLNEMIIQRMLTGIVVVNAAGKIELINNAAIEMLGAENNTIALGSGTSLRATPALQKGYEAWLSQPWQKLPAFKVSESSTEIQAKFANLERSENKRTIIFLEDTRTAAQNAQRLKLASLGRLTGSIAHEIRNPLGAISHAAQLLAEEQDEQNSSKRLSEIIIKHTQRLNQVIENVSQLSRRKAPNAQNLHLESWLNGFIEDYKNSCPNECAIEVETNNPATIIVFDTSQLHQVLTNLLENAHRHSLEYCSQAWARCVCHIDPRTQRPCLDLYDRGEGISAGLAGQVFEPFYTTSHNGSGLGLYLARELCEINFATLDYRVAENNKSGFFRIGFAHPEQAQPRLHND